MSALPNEVSQKARAAREQLAALHKLPQESSQAIEALKEAPETPGVKAPEVEQPAPQPVPTKTPEPQPEPTSAPIETKQTEVEKPKPERTDWKHRFKMLQASREGTKAELAEVRAELKQANQRIAQLTEPQEQPKTRFELDDEIRADLPESEAEVIDRLGQHVDDRFDKFEERQRQEQQRLSEEFFEELSIVSPNWTALDNDPLFNSWLDEVDPDVGVVRRTALNRFVERRNVQAVSGLIKAFDNRSSGQKPEPVVDPISPEPTTQRTANPLGEVVEEENTITMQDISDFYAEKNRLYRLGKLKGTLLEEINEQEKVIKQAMRNQQK